MKTLLNFYPKYYPRLSCTMIDVSAHYGIPPPQKISSYAFIVYYTKYLIFILSDLLKSIIFVAPPFAAHADPRLAPLRVGNVR